MLGTSRKGPRFRLDRLAHRGPHLGGRGAARKAGGRVVARPRWGLPDLWARVSPPIGEAGTSTAEARSTVPFASECERVHTGPPAEDRGLPPSITPLRRVLPKVLAGRIEKVTRTANTMGSIVSRSRTSPWLHAFKGKGEIPRVLLEGGKKYYPIWGTWRSRPGSGWHYYDENRRPMDPDARGVMPHYETKVDYYVVPASPPGPT